MSPRHLAPITVAICTTLASLALATSPAVAAPKKPDRTVRHCEAVVLRVTPFGQQTKVIQAATDISTRGVPCKRARSLIGDSILQVGSAAPIPPPPPGDATWIANDADWWTKKRWRVHRGIGVDPTAPNGGRFIVTQGPIKRPTATIRFTRWS